MAVKIICEPGKVVAREEFLTYPPFSIAVIKYGRCDCIGHNLPTE